MIKGFASWPNHEVANVTEIQDMSGEISFIGSAPIIFIGHFIIKEALWTCQSTSTSLIW